MERGLLKKKIWLRDLEKLSNRIVLITDDRVGALWGAAISRLLQGFGFSILYLSIPPGEASKSRAYKEHLEDRMIEAGMGRDTLILALGGGVVTDLAGFVAATYCRGIPFVTVPSTLLAMVDASIGGKVAVNTPHGKNLIGAFFQPRYVFIDPELLETLPKSEIVNGLSEMIKYGCIASSEILSALQQKKPLDIALIAKGCQVKCAIIERDPHEKGLRRILNFGHTVGHAIESALHYQIPHGIAVAFGMVAEAYVSYRKGILPEKDLLALQALIESYEFPLEAVAEAQVEDCWRQIQRDKKTTSTLPRSVLLKSLGSVAPFDGEYCAPITQEEMTEAFHWTRERLLCPT